MKWFPADDASCSGLACVFIWMVISFTTMKSSSIAYTTFSTNFLKRITAKFGKLLHFINVLKIYLSWDDVL
jgi:hypothetical protein